MLVREFEYFTGQTRGAPTIRLREAAGFGEVVQPYDGWPPRAGRYAWDSGEFRRWANGLPLDAANDRRIERHAARAAQLVRRCGWAPAFVVLPDVVAGGEASIRRSLAWVERLRELRAPLLLAVQDGMQVPPVGRLIVELNLGGLFVGGSKDWKWQTLDQWTRLAWELNRRCHVGRVGCVRDVKRARLSGATSGDSCQGLWSHAQLRRLANAVKQDP